MQTHPDSGGFWASCWGAWSKAHLNITKASPPTVAWECSRNEDGKLGDKKNAREEERGEAFVFFSGGNDLGGKY